MAPLEMNEGTTLGVGHNKLNNSFSVEDPAKRSLTFLTFFLSLYMLQPVANTVMLY
jgi:hypothetical protein